MFWYKTVDLLPPTGCNKCFSTLLKKNTLDFVRTHGLRDVLAFVRLAFSRCARALRGPSRTRYRTGLAHSIDTTLSVGSRGRQTGEQGGRFVVAESPSVDVYISPDQAVYVEHYGTPKYIHLGPGGVSASSPASH
ncbi:hypothetical protein GWI33_006569 [Rhynchophorus ferrugineus]|uniref:Uncharacterized protein n=1 Tax=Rhynchophorus ferrugineus TaxID=354439 RepID=A0A834MDN1_RHYFE|nr:hypothetical protein GWI33_006569 [Rhynchophorus ferrugineus]